MRSEQLTTDQVLEVFTQELATHGGRITDTFNDGRRLFSRSVLPDVKEVRPGDGLKGGVAIKFVEEEICLYPYVFRIVCRNGAIVAQTMGAQVIDHIPQLDPQITLKSIRDGIEACCDPRVFDGNVQNMRAAATTSINQALDYLAFVTTHPGTRMTGMLARIMERFFADKDQSRFGLANAVTAVARDPVKRWNLEELGGAVAVGLAPKVPQLGARATSTRARELAGVA
jgi:hypothetical protein